MVTAAWDTSNLVALYKDGKQCTSCCNIGVPCEHCDVVTPKKVFVEISGASDVIDGLCKCIVFGGNGTTSKFEGVAADDVINHVVFELTQSVSECRWSNVFALDSATLKTYIRENCIPPPDPGDCTGDFIESRKMCWLGVRVTRNASTIDIRFQILGEEDPGQFNPEIPATCLTAWAEQTEFVTCDGDACICCIEDGGSLGLMYDFRNAIINTWSVFCPTMHVNDVSASAKTADCGGDEEKIQVEVTIHDEDDAVLENARVKITLTGGIEDIVYVTTDVTGVATYLSDCLCIDDTVNVEITRLTRGGYIWDPDDDEDSLTDSITMDCV